MSSKISALVDGGAIQTNDFTVVARSGSNYKISAQNIALLPNISVDNVLYRADGITGKKLQTTGIAVDDSNNMSGIADITASNATFSALSVSSLVATDGAKQLTSDVSTLAPTFAGLTLSGLTASRIISTNGSRALTSVADLSDFISGITNKIDVTDDGIGGVSITISPTYVGQNSITTLGTITTGTWNASVLAPTYGGTGVNNGVHTITLSEKLQTTGGFEIIFNATGPTDVTLPTTGTLVNTAVTTLSSLASIGTITTGVWNGTVVAGQYGGTGVANTGKTITLGGSLTTSGAFDSVFTMTGTTNVTFPTSGTLLTAASASTTITGTANQVLVNGTSATPQVGAITLTLPQSIGTSSAVQFGTLGVNITVSNAKFEVLGTALGTTGGNSSEIAQLVCNSGNNDILRFYDYRTGNGSTHATSEQRIQRRIDVTDMGHIAFGSNYCKISGNNGATPGIHIDSSERVGMGVSPSAKLHVQTADAVGMYLLNPSLSSGSELISIIGQGTGGDAGIYIKYVHNSTTSDRQLGLGFNGNNSFLTIKQNGNVGIGGTPTEKLHVSSGNIKITSSANNDLIFETTNRSSIYQNATNVGLQIRSNGSGILQLNNDNSGNVTICSGGGNVGIGTTPTYRLDISYANSSGGVAETGLRLSNTSTTNSTQINLNGNRSWSLMVNGSLGAPAGGFSVVDNTAGASRINVDSSGNIGISTLPSAAVRFIVSGTLTNGSGSDIAGFQVSPSMGSTSGTVANVYGYLLYPNLSANSATVTTYSGFGILSGASAGTVTNTIGIVANTCGFGTNQYAFYSPHGGFNQFNTGATHKLLVTGTAGLSTGTLWTNTSDIRIKKDIETIDSSDVLQLFENLELKKYKYIPEYCADNELDPEKEYWGYIADEIELLEPACVRVAPDSKVYNGTQKLNFDISQRNSSKKMQYEKELNLKTEAIQNREKLLADKDNTLTKLEIDELYPFKEPEAPIYEEAPEVTEIPGLDNLKNVDYHIVLMKAFAAIGELSRRVKELQNRN